jgi:cysteine-rich repeat protein
VAQAGIEACDDGNAIETDACLSTCVTASCGDGFVQAGVEACDDANVVPTDACLNTCVAATCGDGFVQAGVEACDDGNANNSDACLNTCVAATCGDGVIQAGVEACDDGNSDPADACNACQPTTPPVCGDGTVNAGEECDDGNVAAQDGCSESCLDEFCGDDAVQYGLGEICDDGNTIAGDGCSATCQLEGGFTTVAPVLVSGALSCSISQSNTGRKVAVDSLGNVYVAMVCGGNAYVAASTDRGQTYGTPVALGITGISEIAIAAGAPGTAYVAASGGGMARFTRTADAGASWATPTDLVASSDFEISIEAFNDDVFVGIGGGSGVIVLRNDSRGVGAFTQTDVAVSQVFFDVIYDDRTDTLLVCTDTPDFHLRVSTDRGATFAPEVNPAGMAFYSDWAIGNGTIYVAGASGGSDSLILIPAATPGTSSTVAGLPYTDQSSQRALGADPVGNAYIATLLNSGAVQLDRLPFGTTTFAAPRTIAASGTYPGITALPTSTGAAMIYTSAAGGVYATIQTY